MGLRSNANTRRGKACSAAHAVNAPSTLPVSRGLLSSIFQLNLRRDCHC
jgi:hypothetical protein